MRLLTLQSPFYQMRESGDAKKVVKLPAQSPQLVKLSTSWASRCLVQLGSIVLSKGKIQDIIQQSREENLLMLNGGLDRQTRGEAHSHNNVFITFHQRLCQSEGRYRIEI